MRYWGTAVIISMLSIPAAAAAFYSGDEVPILYVPISARATSLGNSLYCSEDEGLRYNPAYLGNLAHNFIYATYGVFLRETTFGNLSMQVKAGTFGVALGYASLQSRFDNYTGPDTDRQGSLSVGQSLFSIASGMKAAGEKFLAGAAIRVVTDSIETTANSGYSADISAGYLFSPALRAGLVVKNVVAVTQPSEDRLPASAVLAASWRPSLRLPGQKSADGNTLFAAAAKNSTPGTAFSLGWESFLSERFAARLGFDRDYPAAGFGVIYNMLNLDFAAAFKEQGLLYFMTLGWTFGGGTAAAPETKTVRKKKPAEPPVAAVETPPADADQEKRDRADALVQDGWASLRENRLQEASDRFAQALKIVPQYRPALYGQQMAQKELARDQKKDTLGRYIAQGREALNKGDYLRANKSFRNALAADPDSEMAREGIRLTVEYATREIGERLKEAGGRQVEFVPLSVEEATGISDSGTFVNLVAALQHLSGRRYRESYQEWQKVQPRGTPLVEKYDAAFAAMFAGELDKAVAKATKLANSGAYAPAVSQLNVALQLPGLKEDDMRKIRGLIASYEYVGKSIADNNLKKAEQLLRQQQYRSAELYLERVVQSGYEADRARQMMTDIKDKEDGPPVEPPADSAVPVQKTEPVPVDTEPAAPPVPAKDFPAKTVPQGQKGSPIGPALKERLLKEYREKAAELSVQNRFKECREYLLRILYLEPGDAEAQRSLDRIDGILRSRGE